ncbi:MAG: type II toxin-antitoxin system PemK/MazF family toxin [bacterium]
MTTYDFGMIVLLNFPHTNLQQSSKRPALVVFDEGDDDVVVVRITSQPQTGRHDFEITTWRQVGLLFQSWVRAGKLATHEKSTIQRVIGKLAPNECAAIKNILQDMFKP